MNQYSLLNIPNRFTFIPRICRNRRHTLCSHCIPGDCNIDIINICIFCIRDCFHCHLSCQRTCTLSRLSCCHISPSISVNNCSIAAFSKCPFFIDIECIEKRIPRLWQRRIRIFRHLNLLHRVAFCAVPIVSSRPHGETKNQLLPIWFAAGFFSLCKPFFFQFPASAGKKIVI